MGSKNLELYIACLRHGSRLKTIAKMCGIERTRFSKIMNGKLESTIEERRKLSKLLKVSQRELF